MVLFKQKRMSCIPVASQQQGFTSVLGGFIDESISGALATYFQRYLCNVTQL
jgi:hypothetical protein